MTREEIIHKLHGIEDEHNVRILFAVETGSRAWGFASPDSDWDVRFVYVHPLEWYLQVEPGRDVIEVMTDDGFDAVGWDIRKALSLYRKTNMTFMEWVNSPIVYIDTPWLRAELNQLLSHVLNVKRGLYHFYHIAVNHQNRYLERRGVELKRYLYYLRALLAAKWMLEHETPPPVPFSDLVGATIDDTAVKKEISNILMLKSQSKEHDKERISDVLEVYGRELEEQVKILIDAYEEHKNNGSADNELNQLLKKVTLQE